METTKINIADYLDSDEMIAEYLNTVLEEGYNADIYYPRLRIRNLLRKNYTLYLLQYSILRPQCSYGYICGSKFPCFATILYNFLS